MTPAAKWVFDEGPQYKKHKRKYMHNQAVNKALCERLESLQVARDPGRLGDIKLGPLNGVYGTRLSRSVRLLYLVDHAARVIRLLAIGDHKEVYGRDYTAVKKFVMVAAHMSSGRGITDFVIAV